jgi:hypothetical protein
MGCRPPCKAMPQQHHATNSFLQLFDFMGTSNNFWINGITSVEKLIEYLFPEKLQITLMIFTNN